jgi:transcriptional regulator with XRE-family HTH domain
MDLATKIYDLRRSLGWTQARLAEASGFSLRSINEWESGKRIPKDRNYREIERACSIEIDKRDINAQHHTQNVKSPDAAERPIDDKGMPMPTHALSGADEISESWSDSDMDIGYNPLIISEQQGDSMLLEHIKLLKELLLAKTELLDAKDAEIARLKADVIVEKRNA